MKTDNGELINKITAEYTSFSDFDLEFILNEYNEENNTKYKLEDIVDFYIKWNTIYLIMSDETEIEYEGVISEGDCKSPDKVYYNDNYDDNYD